MGKDNRYQYHHTQISDKDFKAAITKMLQEVRVNSSETR